MPELLAMPNLPRPWYIELLAFIGKHPILTIFGSFCLLIIFSVGLSDNSTTRASQPTNPNEQRDAQRVTFAAIGAASIKQSMRDPDSFKLTSALIIDKTGAVCYEYRARNGFNGMNVGKAVYSTKGVIKTDEMSGFHSLWNKECANKEGTENEIAVSMMMKLVHGQ